MLMCSETLNRRARCSLASPLLPSHPLQINF
jgi:hypothetical protein